MKTEVQPLNVPVPVPVPREVHPGIKLCRWVFMVAGVLHGAVKLERLKIFDAPLRERERIMTEHRREKLAREKVIAAREERARLTQIVKLAEAEIEKIRMEPEI